MIKNNVKYYDRNIVGRDLIVGDLHGTYDEFMDFLSKLNFDKTKDRVFSVGDLVDRGKKSLECLELIYEDWFYPVYANHEQMMVEAILDDSPNMLDSWIWNGGSWSSEVPKYRIKDAAQYIRDNVPYINVIDKNGERINIVHAEIRTNKYLDMATDLDIDQWNFTVMNEDNLVWGRGYAEGRRQYTTLFNHNLSKTYCGHTPTEEPYEVMQHRFIDGGAVYSVKNERHDRYMYIVEHYAGKLHRYRMWTGDVETVDMYDYFKKE